MCGADIESTGPLPAPYLALSRGCDIHDYDSARGDSESTGVDSGPRTGTARGESSTCAAKTDRQTAARKATSGAGRDGKTYHPYPLSNRDETSPRSTGRPTWTPIPTVCYRCSRAPPQIVNTAAVFPQTALCGLRCQSPHTSLRISIGSRLPSFTHHLHGSVLLGSARAHPLNRLQVYVTSRLQLGKSRLRRLRLRLACITASRKH